MSIINRTCEQLAALDDADLERVARFVVAECAGRGIVLLPPIATDLDELQRATPIPPTDPAPP